MSNLLRKLFTFEHFLNVGFHQRLQLIRDFVVVYSQTVNVFLHWF